MEWPWISSSPHQYEEFRLDGLIPLRLGQFVFHLLFIYFHSPFFFFPFPSSHWEAKAKVITSKKTAPSRVFQGRAWVWWRASGKTPAWGSGGSEFPKAYSYPPHPLSQPTSQCCFYLDGLKYICFERLQNPKGKKPAKIKTKTKPVRKLGGTETQVK